MEERELLEKINDTLTAMDGERPAAATLADSTTNPNTSNEAVMNYNFNETSWDRTRGNTSATMLASGSRTTTQNSGVIVNYNGRGVVVILEVTSAGTGSVTVTIEGRDPSTTNFYTILSGAAVTTNSYNVYKVYPGITAVANAAVSDALPRLFRIIVTANNANAMTYSIGYSIIV